MKIKESDFWECRVDFPGTKVGEVVETNSRHNPEAYPHLFKRIYEFEDGRFVIPGSIVYRIAEKSGVMVVKSVQFDPNVHGVTTEVFSSQEAAYKEFDRRVEKMSEKWGKEEAIRVLNEIVIFSDITEDMSLSQIKARLLNLRESVDCLKTLVTGE